MSGTAGGFYANDHRSQYQAGVTTVTRRAGCTWTSAANAADAATGGRIKRTPDQVHALVKPSEETNASTPGWSLHDAQLALSRLGIKSEIHTGEGWASVEHYRSLGYYLLIQGDSDRFPDGCSGTFDGDHCIGNHPATNHTPEGDAWRIDDPICPTATVEPETFISSYARKFNAGISFLVVFPAVPKTVAPTRFRVSITGPVRLYSKVGGHYIGTVSKATYTCTRTKSGGLWWYRIVVGKRTGQGFKPNRHTSAKVIA